MKGKLYQYFLISLSALLSFCSKPLEEKRNTQFTLLPSEKTGIKFINSLTETNDLSFLDYEYFYNGAGVGVADFDGDGLQDIFLGGNQVADRIYRNKGNMKFEDLSEDAGIDHKGWTVGVSIVDINSDGLPDVYLSRSGPIKADRKNALYINQGDFTFTEEASNYGLDLDAPSTQATFLDYDKDGDLDAYIITHPASFSDSYNIQEIYQAVQEGKWETDRLMRNDNGHFVDVTLEAGIVEYGHTLGVIISDLNNDGWPDIFTANDFHKPDLLLVNNHKGGFFNVSNLAFKHTSNNSMGCDAVDLNNDGYIDLATVDMNFLSHFRSKTNMPSMDVAKFDAKVELGWNHQYMSNALQINSGRGTFIEVAQLSGIHKSDWSWSVLLNDFNGDNKKDIFISNGFKRDIRYNDLEAIIKESNEKGELKSMDAFLAKIPRTLVSNFMFENEELFKYENVTDKWGLGKGMHSHGTAYADFDNDGDLDLIVNNVDSESLIFENNLNPSKYVKVKAPIMDIKWLNARVYSIYENEVFVNEIQNVRGYASSMEACFIHYPDENGKLPSKIVYQLQNGSKYEVEAKQGLVSLELNSSPSSYTFSRVNQKYFKPIANNGGVSIKYIENDFDDYSLQRLLPHKVSVGGPYLCKSDINKDGNEEIFISSAKNSPSYLLVQDGNGNYSNMHLQGLEKDLAFEDEGAAFIDVNNDGFDDLFVSSGGGEYAKGHKMNADRLYINLKNGKFRKQNIKNQSFVNGGKVAKGDFDKDGYQDILVAGRVNPGKYPLPASLTLWKGDGKTLIEADANTLFGGINEKGMLQDLVYQDLNADGKEDLIITGHWMGVEVYYANEEGYDDPIDIANNSIGWFNSLHVTDIDNDGLVDILVGNEGLNNKYQASHDHPLKVYSSDFDSSGTYDIVLAKNEGDVLYPIRGRECSIEQVPSIQNSFEKFEDFASSDLVDIYTPEAIENAYFAEANEFRNLLLKQKDNGTFGEDFLCHQAQISPIMDWETKDINGDGLIDIIGIGNRYNTEVETVRGDAGTGLLLIQRRDGSWNYTMPLESGLYNSNNGRSIVSVNRNGAEGYFIANNNGPLLFFDLK